ncbi:MAG: FecR domain-containing protein [Bacteroidota bacterium]
MTEEQFRKIVRYLAGESTPSEAGKMESWKKVNPAEFKEVERIYRDTPFETLTFEALSTKELTGANRGRRVRPARLLRVAASVTILLAIGVAALHIPLINSTTTNASAQRLTIELPDHSQVVLDKGATLHYSASILGRFNRKVDLSGRGFFTVTPDQNHPFDVKTEHAVIHVLGTRFSVKGSRERTQVVLEEGRVNVSSVSEEEAVQLEHPGQQVIFREEGMVKQSVVKNHLYLSWLNDKLEFNHCNVAEALAFLSDTWDIEIVLDENISLDTELYGTAPSDDPILIIRAIELITQHEISVAHR